MAFIFLGGGFKYVFIFSPIWVRCPGCQIFFRWVEITISVFPWRNAKSAPKNSHEFRTMFRSASKISKLCWISRLQKMKSFLFMVVSWHTQQGLIPYAILSHPKSTLWVDWWETNGWNLKMDGWKTIRGFLFGVWAYFLGRTAVGFREGSHFMVYVRLFVASCSCIYWWWNLLPFLASKNHWYGWVFVAGCVLVTRILIITLHFHYLLGGGSFKRYSKYVKSAIIKVDPETHSESSERRTKPRCHIMSFTQIWRKLDRSFNLAFLPFMVRKSCHHLRCIKHTTRWWFQIFFIFTPTWGRFPFWLIFFKGVETAN